MYRVCIRKIEREVFLGSFIAESSTGLEEEIERLSTLTGRLKSASSSHFKVDLLNQDSRVAAFFNSHSFVKTLLEGLSKEEELVLKSIVAIGQQSVFFEEGDLSLSERNGKVRVLIDTLLLVESFYREMGGVVGYQLTLLQFLCKPKQRFLVDKSQYRAPCGLDLSEPSLELREMIYHSIDKMGALAEMYPVGGAADRLRLQDPETGTLIPAAMLSFNGQTLLGKLIEDLQSREYLYFKIKGEQITIPVAMMTSKEKNNHEQIQSLCEKSHWFFRPKEKFSFFCQPLVPVVNREGNWVMPHPLTPLFKPGGHGVIWKLARDTGVISWLMNQGSSKAIIRQINNPVSSEDYHLIAFSGYGLKEDKRFGFASCERQVKASEGINVVVEEEKESGFSYTLTNIEYCDFQAYNIQDEPAIPGGRFSKFPSNTNLLFVDLPSILEAIEEYPLPGILVNLKKMQVKKSGDQIEEEEVARLESTMQNIADFFQKRSEHRLEADELLDLDTYITFNKRQKTISATKKEFSLGASLLETPEGCFLDVLANTRDLLENYCQFSLPPMVNQAESFTNPSFLFYYHPSLGPIYSLIGKKLRRGSLAERSEFRLHVAECDIENISIQGSCLIVAARVMGFVDSQGILRYSNQVGRCTLRNVSVKNKGIDYSQENVFWKPHIFRHESCRIFLEGESEFYAENVSLEGDVEIRVEDGYKVTAKEEAGKVVLIKEKLQPEKWHWHYYFDEDKFLHIEKKFT